jgi:hypothetical protein
MEEKGVILSGQNWIRWNTILRTLSWICC